MLHDLWSLSKAKRIHYVADVVRGSPAFEAGLRNGLVITDVNGEHMGGKMNEYVVKKITDYNDVYLRVDRPWFYSINTTNYSSLS